MAALLLCGVVGPALHGQTAAQIRGVVLDQNGTAIDGAKVEVTGMKLADHRDLTTDSTGTFVFAELPPDTYQVTAACPVCNDASSIVALGVGQTRSIQLNLDTASATSVVSLDTHATTIDATSAKLGMNVGASEIASLPVNGRTLAPLALTAPLVANGGAGSFSDLHFAGQSAQQNRYLLDNVDDSSVVSAEPSFIPLAGYEFRLRNSLDTIEEFRVDSAGYSVEDGFASGGQIKLVSKSGSAALHGSLFEYFRNDKLQTRNFFDSAEKSPLHMNQYGASVGGPVLANKLFGFGSFEQLKQRAGFNVIETVPSQLLRSAAVPSIRSVLSSIPLGLVATADPDTALASRQGLASQDETNFSGRLDYLASARNRFFLRYSSSTGSLTAPDDSTTDRSISARNQADQTVLNWNFQIGPTTINQLTLGLNRAPTQLHVMSGFPSLAGSRILIGNQASGSIASPGDQMQLAGSTYGSAATVHGRTYNAQDTIDWVKGAHSISAGASVQLVRVPFSTWGGTTYFYRDVESFIANTDADLLYSGDLPSRKAEKENYAGYVQDEIHLASRMHLLLGLRYEYVSPTRESQDQASLFNPVTFQFVPAKGGFYRASKFGFEPRVAFTWSPQALKSDTVLRLGAGIYNGPSAFIETLTPIENSTAHLFLPSAEFFRTPAQVLSSPDAYGLPRSIDSGTFGLIQRNYLLTASIQRALPHRFVGEAAYAGILSRHLTQTGMTNLGRGVDPETGDTLRTDSRFSGVPVLVNGGTSSYHALRLNLNRKFVDDLTLSLSYTLAHSIGNTGGSGEENLSANPACLACEHAANNFDTRHTASLNAVYRLPFGKGYPHLNHGFLGSALGGWNAAAMWNVHSGLPVNVLIDRSDEIYFSPSTRQYYSPTANRPTDAKAVVNGPYGMEGFSASRPDYVSGVDPYLKGGVQWLNPKAFAIPMPGSLGNLGRNALRGPSFQQLDLHLGRTLSIRDRWRFEVAAEAFNVLNHTNFSNPTAILPDATTDLQPGSPYTSRLASGFGVFQSTLGKTVGLGTSRQFQFSLRVDF